MACKGYIRKDFPDGGSGRFRARWVLPPYDAYDEAVPPNKVVFDSDDIGTTSVLAAGSHDFTSGSSSGSTWYVDNFPLATWTLPFVPLCMFQFATGFDGPWSHTYNASRDTDKIIVSTTGIRMWMSRFGIPSPSIPWRVKWTALRIPAT